MGWAENESTSDLVEHSMYGRFYMTLPKEGGPGILLTQHTRILIHGFIMWGSWFIFGLFMIITN